MAILIINAIPPYLAGDGEDSDFDGYIFPALLGGLLIVSTAYYLLFFGAAPRSYELVQDENSDVDSSSFNPPEPVKQDGIINAESRWNLMRWANVQCEIRKDYTYDRELGRVYRFGRRWRAIFSVPGDPAYLPPAGQENPSTPPKTVTFPMFLYWLFGGTRLNPKWNPYDIVSKWWKDTKKGFHKMTGKLKPR
ncbi:hypothetical protein ACHAPT_000591 [Fusarium lateritium]